MTSFFGVELCDLIGLYALSKLKHLYNYKDMIETMEYIESTANTFKSRWYNHNHSFNTLQENNTELAKYIWFLKNNNIKYDIKWNIIHHIGEVRRIHNMCSTCNLEKLEIARASKRNNLNKRHELFANCPHLKKLHFKT